MINKNLTPFHFGTKVTSRVPGQLEMTAMVRATLTLAPGQPLAPIKDPIEQGFMTGHVFAEEDVERTGAPLYPDDFADWKPQAEVMVKGAAYPPDGAATECSVGVSVGWWKKSLAVVGPRAWRKRMIGSTLGDPLPFERMPLTWENAYGGPDYAENPVGQGHKTEELPRVLYAPELPKHGKKVAPASFMPLNPTWPQRARKLGKKYGKQWKKTREPFFAEDFDWTWFSDAPADQQLEGYLRGDEALVFENMHPEQSWWETQLPGLRLRVFVRDDQERHYEVRMHLDTLFADLDEGRLYLTWRGLQRVRELDLTDVVACLVAAERMQNPPQRAEYYRDLLDRFVADPLGLEEKFPEGFLEMAKRLEAEEAAELAGVAVPAEQKVDPFGIRAKMGQALGGTLAAAGLAGGVPAAKAVAKEGMRDRFPPGFLDLAEALRQGRVPVPPAVAGRPEVQELSETELVSLNMASPDQQPTVLEQLVKAKAMAEPDHVPPKGTLFQAVGTGLAVPPKAVMPVSDEPPPVEDPRPRLEALSRELLARRARLEAQGVTSPLLGLFDKAQRLIAGGIAMSASMLDAPRAPLRGPDLSQLKAGLATGRERLALEEGPEVKEQAAKLDQLDAELEKLETHFPPPEPDEAAAGGQRDFAGQDLRGQDFSGQELAGKSFAGADLADAKLAGADLSQADFRGANLTGADLSGATLSQAQLGEAALMRANLDGARLDQADLTRAALTLATLRQADLSGATLDEAVLEQAQLQAANLSGASLRETVFARAELEGADLSGAQAEAADFGLARLPRASCAQIRLDKAGLSGADLSGADLSGASLVEAELTKAVLAQAKLPGACLESALLEQADLRQAQLEGADLRFAQLSKACLEGANLKGADLSLATVDKVRADGVDLSEANLELATLLKARLRKAKLRGTRGSMTRFDEADLQDADAQGADLSTCDLVGANLERADFSGAVLERTSFRKVRAAQARFVGARLAQSAFSMGADLRAADFNRALGPRSIWQEAVLDGANYAFALLPQSHFQNCRGEGVRFHAAELKGAGFRKAAFRESVFNLANLCRADLTHTTLERVQFQGSNCYGLVLLEATLSECDFAHANLNGVLTDDGVQL